MSPRHVIEYSGKPDGASDNGPKVRNVSKRAHGDVQLLWDRRHEDDAVLIRPAQQVGDTSSLWDVLCLPRSSSLAPFAWELVESVAALGKDWRVQRCCQGVGVAFREMPEVVHFHLKVLVLVEDAFPSGRLPELLVGVAPRLVPSPWWTCGGSTCEPPGPAHASCIGSDLFR